MVQYTVNPLTARPIRIGGPTFNQLIIEAYDFLDGRLVRRVTAGSPPSVPRQYYNVRTGRMVQEGSRTFQLLTNFGGYNVEENYYLIPPSYYVQDTINTAIDAGNELEQQRRLRNQLTEIGLTLCRDCQMPIKIGEELCDECTECNTNN